MMAGMQILIFISFAFHEWGDNSTYTDKKSLFWPCGHWPAWTV